jgi:hypothetical protein
LSAPDDMERCRRLLKQEEVLSFSMLLIKQTKGGKRDRPAPREGEPASS